MNNKDRLFIGVFPTGIVYADLSTIVDNDYTTVAFLAFDTLELAFRPICPEELKPAIEASAKKIQARKGEQYPTDQCGHTVLLGSKIISTKPVVNLTCAVCGNGTRGRQWYNRDTGYGLCPRCAEWLRSRKNETPASIRECYGIQGVHYEVQE